MEDARSRSFEESGMMQDAPRFLSDRLEQLKKEHDAAVKALTQESPQ